MAFSVRNVRKFLEDQPELLHRKAEILAHAEKLAGGHLTMSGVAADMLFGRRWGKRFHRIIMSDHEHIVIGLTDMAEEARKSSQVG